MTAFTPEWRVRINGYTVTDATLANLSITSGRLTIYEQPGASYSTFSLITDPSSSVPYQINDPVTIEVKDSNGDFVVLFGGFLTDISIAVTTAGTIQTAQEIRMVAVGALARLARADFSGNLASDMDGNQIYELLQSVLLSEWQEVPGGLTWENYDPTTTWANAGNTGLGQIDRPGDYELEAQSNLNDTIYNIAAQIATSGFGYLYEDNQGRIGYADSTRRGQYLAANGYTDLDARQAVGSGLEIIKRAGDVRNKINIVYGSSGNASVSDQDDASIALFGLLAAEVRTTIKGQTDAENQATFYLAIRSNPQYELRSITFPLGNPEMDDTDRDALLNVFMGQPVNIQNLPANMTGGQYQGFVEGWTWRAGVKGLNLDLIVSPVAFSLQAFKWLDVPAPETWNTISPTLDWLNATIVA